MMTHDIPEWQQAQMQNVSCLASSSEQADMQAAADAAQEMMDADVAAAAERYAKSMRDIRLNMQKKAMRLLMLTLKRNENNMKTKSDSCKTRNKSWKASLRARARQKRDSKNRS